MFDSSRRRDSKRTRDSKASDNRGGGHDYRIATELSAVEKALTKKDFAQLAASIAELRKHVSSLPRRTLLGIGEGTRGKLITTLMRVTRTPKPAAAPAAEAPAAESAATPAAETQATEETAAAGADATAEATPTEEAQTAEASAAEAQTSETQPTEAPPPEASPEAPVAAEKPSAPASDPWSDTQYAVGLIWSLLGESDRAESSFTLAGRKPDPSELKVEAPPREERPAEGRGRQERRKPRERRPSPGGQSPEGARSAPSIGRIRSAARLSEKRGQYAEAFAQYEASQDLPSALRCAARAKLDADCARLEPLVKPEEAIAAYESAQAWERLMALHVRRQDFGGMALLYEKSRQFFDAAQAWERAEKLTKARKAYERAQRLDEAQRVRALEIADLFKRGDRLGAAKLLMTLGNKDETIAALEALPPVKMLTFMRQLKLRDDALRIGRTRLAAARAQGDVFLEAQWLEALGEKKAAGEAYKASGHTERAAALLVSLAEFKEAAELYASVGQHGRAAQYFERAGFTTEAARERAAQELKQGSAPAAAEPPAPTPVDGGTA